MARKWIETLESRTLLTGTGWSASDAFTAPAPGARATALATDAAGNVYSAGYSADAAGVNHGLVREKPAGSTTWTTLLDYAYVAGRNTMLKAITITPDGQLYVAGTGADASGTTHWITVGLAPGGAASLADDFVVVPGHFSQATAAATDPAGDVFVVGSAVAQVNRTSSTEYWYVREKLAGSSVFTTVDSYCRSASTQNTPWALAVVPSGPAAGLYVTGACTGSSSTAVTRKSVDGGATWATIDDYAYNAGNTSSYGIAADASGNLFVAGFGVATTVVSRKTTTTQDHWLVRKSTDGGATWSLNDDWTYSSATSCIPYGLGIDAGGNVNVVGSAQDSAGSYHGIVRSNAGGSWALAADYQLAPGKTALLRGFATDTFGLSYVAGNASDSAGNMDWVVLTSGPVQVSPSASSTSFSQALQPSHVRRRTHSRSATGAIVSRAK